MFLLIGLIGRTPPDRRIAENDPLQELLRGHTFFSLADSDRHLIKANDNVASTAAASWPRRIETATWPSHPSCRCVCRYAKDVLGGDNKKMEYSRTYLTVLHFSFLPPVSSARPPDQAPGRVAEHNDRRRPTDTMRKVGSDSRTTCRQLQSSVAIAGRDEDTVTTAAHDGERFDAGRVGFGRQFVEPSANARAISAAAPRWPPPAVAADPARQGDDDRSCRDHALCFTWRGFENM
jgi:hypothetical protein